MDKQRARQLYELADRLSKLDVNTLSEQQLEQRNSMIAKLQEEVAGPKSCWPGYRKVGTKPGTGKNTGKQVNDCEKIKEENVAEGIVDNEDKGEYDNEGGMAKDDLSTIEDAATELRSILSTDENLPEWVQAKITKAMDYIDTARDYMKSKKNPVTETKVKPTEFVNKNPKLTAVNIKQTDPVSEEINTEAYERLQKVFAFKNYES